jgi:hypothetical protein
MSRQEGAIKTAAKRLGMSVDEYRANIARGLKWCHRCRSWLPVHSFAVDNSRGDKLAAKCTRCRRKTTGPDKKQRQAMKATGRAWCCRCREWLPLKRVRGGVCRRHINQADRERYAKDPKYRAERRQHAHARKRGVKPVPYAGQQFLTELFAGRCAFCGSEATTWDHLIPVTRRGETTPGNVVPACASCNSSKNNRELFAWMRRKGFVPSDELVERLILAEAGLYG